MDYKESFYNFKKLTSNKKLVLYNTKSGAVSIVKPQKIDEISNILKNPNNYNKENKSFKQLVNLEYIIKSTRNELKEIKNTYENYIDLKEYIHLTLLPAEDCNFGCPYCFNYDQKGLLMEDWVYEGIFNFINNIVDENNQANKKTTLNLTWFGGEPTIASNKIIEFMNKLNKIKNLLLSSNIVTNGYLLNKKLFKKMLDSGISAYQVTLDGYKNNHDKLRVLKDGEPTFEHIYNNILDISKNIKKDFSFYIRGNFLKDNINSMEKLISKFNKDFNDDDRFNIYFRPVDDYDTKDFSKDKNLNSNICNINSGLDIQEKLSSKIKKNDSKEMRIFDSLPQPTYSWCDVERNNHYIFGADGSIYICDTFIGNKEKSKGKIIPEGKLILNKKIKKWRTSIFNEDKNNLTQNCYDCKILPICMGGCRRVRILNNHSACYWTPKRILNRMEKYEKTI